ncbi:D123 family protein [Tritrichomonas foetus]|uniref:D123 family protein n=1 Tax=Tritrichomonas foetus TaxID=1144522 RepID=A0A1J4JLU7_9EUKA|nr:D123 family protein [Tritrichomonas foetus]|eukprot:OHS98509.1 D123 family protein [Tritrichomonas foetus]
MNQYFNTYIANEMNTVGEISIEILHSQSFLQNLENHFNISQMENTIKCCSYDNWYESLRKTNQAVRSQIIPLPDDFIEFLLTGEFLIEENMFPDLEAKVKEALRDLGGHAFVKLNFTAPLDAQWIGSQRTMEIKEFQDIIYILKASTRVLLDITQPFGEKVEGIKPILVLKKYFDYRRDREFRVFQKTKGLRFISSRYDDVPCHIEEEEVNKLINEFINHVSEIIKEENLIFDVYISPKMRIHLVDVAPWNDATSAAMFTWEEIKEMNNCETRLCHECVIHPVEDPAVPVELTGGASLDEIIKAMKELENL